MTKLTDLETENGVAGVFTDLLGAKLPDERELLVFSEYPGWDSVAHMALVAALEEKFDCMLDMDDIIDMSSFEKSIAIMAKYA